MKIGKRSLILAVALMLALSTSVFSTIAYLTSSAKATNTFTVGDVEIELDETDVDEDGNPKYPVDTNGDGKPDVEISIDDKGTITVDPTPDDPTDDPIVIKPGEDGKYPPTDIDGDGKDDQIEVGGGTITVTAEETALFTQITVEDTGPGFSEKDIPHLFERFYKGDNASESSYGIGLALARMVITAQNGTIQAMNTDSGAKFVIKFYKQVI